MKIIDLSMEIREGMQTFEAPWHTYVEISQMGRHGIENRETKKLTMGTHTGTHIDAPLHFIKNGKVVDDYSLEHICGEASIVDFSILPEKAEVSESMIIEALGSDKCPERIIFRFDWDKHLGKSKYYIDHPFLSISACKWLADNGCKVIALDTPQPDNPLNGRHGKQDAPNHKILLAKDVLIVEYLVNISKIESRKAKLIVAPLKIKNADGAPARVFAICE